MKSVRTFYLRLLRSDELNEKFGGPVFVSLLIATSLLLAMTWLQTGETLFKFADSPLVAQHEDFTAFYRGGELAAEGRASEVYTYEAFADGLSYPNKAMFFLNPPHALLFFEPLASLSYSTARGLFLVTSFLCLVLTGAIIRMNAGFWPYVFLLFSVGALYSFRFLQLAPIITFMLLFALLFSRTRPVLSGLFLCVLTIKPQYGLLVPVYLLALRDWRAFTVAAVGTIALVAASVWVYGVGAWEAFFASMSHGVHSLQFKLQHNIMITIGQSLGKLEFAGDVKAIVQIVCILLAAVFVWNVASRGRRDVAAALSLLTMCLVAPSFMFYDWLLYSAALLLLLKAKSRWPLALQFSGGLLWVAPILHDVLIRYDTAAAFFLSTFIPVIAFCVLVQAASMLSLHSSTGPFQLSSQERPRKLPI